MGKIAEELVAQVVADVSERMKDPRYGQLAIGGFAQAHPEAGRFMTAHVDDLGGGEEVMHAIFHAELVHECFKRALGRHLSPVGFVDLDDASTADPVARLKQRQPALWEYLDSNVEQPEAVRLIALIALTMDRMN